MRLLATSLWTRFLKRQLPTSLWGRSLLIIVLPVLVMQVAVTWAFFDLHWQTVTARLYAGKHGGHLGAGRTVDVAVGSASGR